jgi:hypothetical protein
MKPEHRATLLEIADAWIRCAEEAERGEEKAGRDPEKGKDDDSDELASSKGSTRGKRNRAGRPPPGYSGDGWRVAGRRCTALPIQGRQSFPLHS